MSTTSLHTVRAELDAHAVPYRVEPTKGGHIRVAFHAGGREHSQIVAASESDHRAPLNARAHTRRLLRDAGITLREPAKVRVRTSKDRLIVEGDKKPAPRTMPAEEVVQLIAALRQEMTEKAARAAEDIEALAQLLTERPPAPSLERASKRPFVRPSILRAMRREL